jgi:site-specific DNA recombinase
MVMKAAIYARVSTERQAERGTIGSQLEALRAHLATAGHELASEYRDDGHSGARLDRPGLDALRDAAEAGLFEVVWCLSPDRLARSYAYQVLILDELARLGVSVTFTDTPGLDQNDPQAKLLTQVQGVIAEYERAKIGERYRRGKLFRSRAGEVISRKAPYGYRRIPRGPDGPARLEIYEPEAVIARRIFAERASGTTIRQICRQLNAGAVPTPTGSRAVWGTSTLARILRSEAYIGRIYFNRTETVPARRPGQHSRQIPRPRAEWIAIPCPPLISEETFEAASKVSHDNTKWSPRRAEPGAWLLRGLVKCGPCDVGTSCHKMRGRNGTWHRYYYCHNHDPLRAGGQDRRCPERNIRADALDEFVFTQIRAALLDPAMLLAGEQAIAVHAPVPDDQLLAAELARLDRRLEAARTEHNRLVDLYQAGLIDMPELQRRAAAITARQRDTSQKRASLAAERADLARGNRLRHGVEHFAARVRAVIDQLDPTQRQELIRLLIEDVQVTGWHVKIRLRIPLDDPPHGDHTHRRTPQAGPAPASGGGAPPMSTEDRLRSLHGHQRAQLPAEKPARRRRNHRGQRDRLTSAGQIIKTGTVSYPLAHAPPAAERQEGRQRARPPGSTRGGPGASSPGAPRSRRRRRTRRDAHLHQPVARRHRPRPARRLIRPLHRHPGLRPRRAAHRPGPLHLPARPRRRRATLRHRPQLTIHALHATPYLALHGREYADTQPPEAHRTA